MKNATDETNEPIALERVPSGVRGLDVVFGGGFVRGAVYLVMGRPGTGNRRTSSRRKPLPEGI